LGHNINDRGSRGNIIFIDEIVVAEESIERVPKKAVEKDFTRPIGRIILKH
jgi:hypothetical protein